MADHNTKYIFNSNEYGKGRLVLAVVKKFVGDTNPSLIELKNTFTTKLQGRMDVVVSKEDYLVKKQNSNDSKNRYFTKEHEAVRTSDGKIAFVTNQWGSGNIADFINRAKELNYDIKVVGDMTKTIKELYEEYKINPRGDWIPKYRMRCQQLSEYKGKDPRDYDVSLLKDIWQNPNNGIAKASPGVMSKVEFDSLLPDLPLITSKIVENPSPEILNEVNDWAKEAKESKKFRTIKWGVIHRVFCAANPEEYSTILNKDFVIRLIEKLNELYDLGISLIGNWADLNIALMSAIKAQGLEDEDIFFVNTFTWWLYRRFVKSNGESLKIDEKNKNDLYQVDSYKSLNRILYGPPGTGKTYNTISRALEILEPDFYEKNNNDRQVLKEKFDELKDQNLIGFVTFHQSFSYEDFVEGLRAEASDNGNGVRYYVQDGIFKILCDVAKKDSRNSSFDDASKKPVVLIIDEINRGNTANIFGELITLIEPSKRLGEEEALYVTLPYSKEKFSVPNNLHIIGTMNTADRSLSHIDTALRRRFVFEEMMPKPSLLSDINVDGVDIRKMLTIINDRIEVLYDREHTIGHSFFMSLNDDSDINDLAAIFNLQIIPLLEEYFFEDWDKIRLVLGDDKKLNENAFVIKKYNDSRLIELLGDDHQRHSQDSVYKRNASALNNPNSYIGIYQTTVESVTE